MGLCKMVDDDPRKQVADDAPILGRDAILAIDDKKIERVHVPEWGGSVFVRVMSGRERDEFESGISTGGKGKANMADFRARFAAAVICDAVGNTLFARADVEALTKKSGAALDRVFDAGKRLNRIGEDEERELVENFGVTPDGDSGSN